MRIARKMLLLAMLVLAPFAAKAAAQAEIEGPKCGDCQCSDNQCCSKSWTGSCSCYTCEQT